MHPFHTLVLTAAPGSGAITDGVLDAALGALEGKASETRWLAPGDAWEARVALSPPGAALDARRAIADAVGARPVDVNIVASATPDRRKRLLAADMESTIIEQELIDEMAGLAGCHAEISAITAASMKGEIDFEASLVRRVALFAGLEAARLEPLLGRVTLMPGAARLVATMHARGGATALISGGFTIFAERIARLAGFDDVVANSLEIEDGRLTGRVHAPILGPRGKALALARLSAERSIPLADTLAVGDGANDMAMLAAAGLGVAFRAKPVLEEQASASANGAVVRHGDLTALLYLQGYGRKEIGA